MNAPVTKPAFAHCLPARAPTLKDLVVSAVTTQDTVRIAYANGATLAEIDALEDAAWEAGQALVERFRVDHGISKDWLRRMGGVI